MARGSPKCHRCKTTMNEDLDHCPKCGVSSYFECRKCGAKWPRENGATCPNCGSKAAS